MEASAALLDDPIERFIQVVEIWEPSADGRTLEVTQAHYGACQAFGQSSQGVRFERGCGLPGRVWETQRPVVLQGLMGGLFERVVAAADAGLGAGLGIPVVVDGEFRAAVLMLFGVRQDISGIVEVWERQRSAQRLSLTAGFHGALTRFARGSQGVRLEQGRGLPGMCWSAAMPIIVEDVGHWHEFVRRSPAEQDEVTTGVGIPLFKDGEVSDVVTLLGTRSLDLAERVEVWDTRDTFPRLSAAADAIFTNPLAAPGGAADGHAGLAGAVANECRPRIRSRDGQTAFGLPIIDGHHTRAVITFEL